LILSIQRQVIDEHKELHDTTAGMEVLSRSDQLVRKFSDELQKLLKELSAAPNTDIEELQEELSEYKQKLSAIHSQWDKLLSSSVPLSVAYAFPISSLPWLMH
jgi:predicted  nucleic acid-binding Zn-ribbon protein